MKLTQNQIEEFFDAGYVAVPDLFTPSEILEIGECMDRLQAMATNIKTTTVYRGTQFVVEGNRIDRIVWCGAAEPRLLDYSADSRLLTPVSQLLGSRSMQQLVCQMHPKIGGDNVAFDWHQDSQHRGYGTADWRDVNGRGSYVQTLTAVDEVTRDNGPVCFIPRSGHGGHLYLDQAKNPADVVDTAKAIPVLMKPGTTVFFSPYVVHGSSPNMTTGRRRVFINGFAYPGANSRKYPGEGSGRMLSLDESTASKWSTEAGLL